MKKNDEIVIGVLGFEFVSPNKGCEALVYSFFELIDSFRNSARKKIVYVFAQNELGILPAKYPDIEFIAMPVNLRDIHFKYFKALMRCDYIFDVTMGDSFSDIYSKEYFNYLVKLKRITLLFNKAYILLPQTYGPFKTNNSKSKAKKVLNKAMRIYCRDEMSQKVLSESFGINDAYNTTDMAFALPFDKKMFSFDSNQKIKLGFNISGLLYKGGFNSSNQFDLSVNYKKFVEDIINFYSNNDKYEIHLIAHVLDTRDNAYDDDYKICTLLSENNKGIVLAPEFSNPIEAKSYISNMDIFIGSRMHATIAAFSSGVVTIPVSYSRKFEGLYNGICYEYIINAREENNSAIFEKIKSYIDNSEKLSKAQKKSIEIANDKINDFKLNLNELISERGEK